MCMCARMYSYECAVLQVIIKYLYVCVCMCMCREGMLARVHVTVLHVTNTCIFVRVCVRAGPGNCDVYYV